MQQADDPAQPGARVPLLSPLLPVVGGVLVGLVGGVLVGLVGGVECLVLVGVEVAEWPPDLAGWVAVEVPVPMM
jgi:hypothetical protein